jgi:hypothetical protein
VDGAGNLAELDDDLASLLLTLVYEFEGVLDLSGGIDCNRSNWEDSLFLEEFQNGTQKPVQVLARKIRHGEEQRKLTSG